MTQRTSMPQTRARTEALAALEQLQRLGAAVRALGEALQVAAPELADAESLDALHYTTQRSVADLAAWDADAVRSAFATLGDDLTLDLEVKGLDPAAEPIEAQVRAGRDPLGTLRNFAVAAQAAHATQGEDISLHLRLRITKREALRLARQVATARDEGEDAADPVVAVVYLAAAWEARLTLSASALWERLFPPQQRGRSWVVLCDAAGCLAGAALVVLGAQTPPPVESRAGVGAWRRFHARAAAQRQLHSEQSIWREAPPVLTPEHLHLRTLAPGLEVSAERLARLSGALALACLAPVALGPLDQHLELRMGQDRRGRCTLDDAALATLSTEGAGALRQLAAWAYAAPAGEKLALARGCLALELGGRPVLTLAEVAAGAPAALDAARANLAISLRGQTERYFALRQAASEAVAQYAETVRTAVTSLTADVVETVYRTVALLVGVVVAGVVQPTASLLVARLAAALYAAYMGFLLAFVLRERQERFALEGRALAARLAAMPELADRERAALAASALPATEHFTRYFARSRVIYWVLLALSAAVFVVLLLRPG